jgi:hypothetical protein
MTAHAPHHRPPGDRLIKLATLIFDEPTRSTFVIPALADFQQELREAGDHPRRRLTAHLRGWAAFARLVLAAPFIGPSSPMGSPVATFVTASHGGNLLLVLAVALMIAPAVRCVAWFSPSVSLSSRLVSWIASGAPAAQSAASCMARAQTVSAAVSS